MKEKTKSPYSDGFIRIMGSCFVVANALFQLVTAFFGFIIWKFSPNTLIALFVITCTTTIPILYLLAGIEVSARVAIFSRKILPKALSNALCSTVKYIAAKSIVFLGKMTHGYEVHGEENLPENKAGMIVFHHALIAYDAFYFTCEKHAVNGSYGGIMNRDLRKLLWAMSELFNIHSERAQLVEALNRGQLMFVSPGGVEETLLGGNYELCWGGRVGFAEVAKECGVPVIPMFTANSEEAMPVRCYGFRDLLKEVYARTKRYLFLPLICFPVKLRTHFGEPLHCGADETPAEFAKRVEAAIYELRDRYQRQPQSFILALLERFGYESFDRESGRKER